MTLLTKKIILDSTNDISNLKNIREERIKVILLNEHVFIKIFKVNKGESSEKKIDELIKNMFSIDKPLVHYEKLWLKGKCYLIVYLIRCDKIFERIIKNKKSFKLILYDLILGRCIGINKIRIVISSINKSLKIRVYFKNKLVSLKLVTEESYVDDIKEELHKLKNIFGIDSEKFDLIVEREYINENLSTNFNQANIKEIRGDKYLYSKI